MTMRERMQVGKLFKDRTEGLPEERRLAKLRMQAFNATGPDDGEKRKELLEDILGRKVQAWIEPPFYFCYGRHIEIGAGTYINFNCNFVDDGKIQIGEKVLFGPAVTVATVGHPIHPDYREYMYTASVIIGNCCWIGAGAILCPGVTVGENSVIGAGSVVVRDIPANVVAAGNPCRVIREIDERDRKYYFKKREFDF